MTWVLEADISRQSTGLKMSQGWSDDARLVSRLKLQRLFAVGPGALPSVCIVDVGAIGRWLYESIPGRDINATWDELVDGIGRSKRRFIWVVAFPGEPSKVFGTNELDDSRKAIVARGVCPIICSSEGVGSLLAPGVLTEVDCPPVVVTAQVGEYMERLFPLEGIAHSLLDLGSGRVHTYASVFRDGPGEPLVAPLKRAAVSPDPADKRGRPPAGNAAHRYENELEREILGAAASDFTLRAPTRKIPRYLRASWWENLTRTRARERTLRGDSATDAAARAAVQKELRASVVPSSSASPPIVVAAFDTALNGALNLSASTVSVLHIGATPIQVQERSALRRILRELAASQPNVWVAPRALDLLGFMVDQGLPLPEAVIDPAMCAFALCPDNIDDPLLACPSSTQLVGDAAEWMWDVKRKAPPPRDLSGVVRVMPSLMRELRAQTAARGLDALIDDDLARTLPVLATIERQGAWVSGTSTAIWEQLQREMSLGEQRFRPTLDDLDPYFSSPERLVPRLRSRGLGLPTVRQLPGISAADELERMAAVHPLVKALVDCRMASNVQEWLLLIEGAAGRLRGRHFVEATGRWGMNQHPLQAMPKHSVGAKAMRSLLAGPPGLRLVAADFSSFELRLLAGLSKDPTLLNAAGQQDAIGSLAQNYFGVTSGPSARELMKRYIYPLTYGGTAWGFAKAQPTFETARAFDDFAEFNATLPTMFRWKTATVAAALGQGVARTQGGWQRDPRAAASRHNSWIHNAIVSTLVQGLAADIMRWCLRTLHKSLGAMDAQLVFQNHDEVYVATDDANVGQVRAELKDVLERRVLASGLVPAGIRLVAKVKDGVTWADVA